MAAINPEARSYEDLVATCRELSISESEIEQLFTRMVFNVMANNTDDHNKNFSFLLEEDGKWRMSPSYDTTFIFNTKGTGPNIERRLSIGGEISEISKTDLLDFAKQHDIKNANAIINRVAEVISKFGEYAERCHITQPWRGIIQKTLNDNLIAFGYISKDDGIKKSLCDMHGRTITDFSVSVNSKGHYEVVAIIDGQRHRRFVRPNMNLYTDLTKQDIYNLPADEKIRLAEILFPPK